MAVDMIARLMAMGNSGGAADAYTKDETDALLASKADESYVDGIADMVIDKMQLWADYIADYDTAMLAKQASLDMSDSEKKQQFVMQKVHLQKLKSKYAYLQAYYEQHGELPETVTFDSITNAGGCMYRTESNGEVKVAVLKGSANGMIVDSPDFTATASTSDASRTTAHQISSQFGIEISGYGWISVSIETTGTLFSSFSWSGYPSSDPAWWGVNMSGNTYIPVITGTRNINGYTFDNGILFSLPENTVNAETPWDYYNNYVLPDLAAGNAAFPTGYAPTPKAKFYTKDETDELLEDMEEEVGELLDGKADIIDGKVPASQLPSYVDDTVEGYFYSGTFYEDAEHTTAITGERGKIYVDLTTNKSYRWTGAIYTRVDECPAFGETQGTIYEGHKGKANADNIGTMSSLTTTAKSSLVAAINELNDGKANKSTTYNKTEVDARVAALASESGNLADRGAKNLYHVTATTATNNNVTFTVYSDGSVGVKTTSSGASQSTFFFLSGYMVIQPGTYMLSGGISNSVMLYDGADTNPWKSTGEAAEKTFNAATNLRLCIRVNSGYTSTSEVIVKPMVCTKADYDASSAYVPYAPTNRQLFVSEKGYTAESSDGSFSAIIHNAAEYCGVDDSSDVNGFVVVTSDISSEYLIGFFNFRYLRNVVVATISNATITYSTQSQYGTLTFTGTAGTKYKATVKFL